MYSLEKAYTTYSYNDVKRGEHLMQCPQGKIFSDQIREANGTFPEIYWLNCPVGHRRNWFFAFDVIIRMVYRLFQLNVSEYTQYLLQFDVKFGFICTANYNFINFRLQYVLAKCLGLDHKLKNKLCAHATHHIKKHM
jgi:hypothetical protein